MITLAQKMGIWVENDAHKPEPGDIILYDWDDSGSGDNKGNSDHVGVVEKVSGTTITVIEGNYSNAVKRRTLKVNGKYIRGYIVPKFEAVVESKPVARELISIHVEILRKGCKGDAVKAMQILLAGNDCKCGISGADGDFGPATEGALKEYQEKKKLEVDGICGPATWASLLGMK
jgi:peptidoglycan hydrolase-like protein with peptidoglycan-binding domain